MITVDAAAFRQAATLVGAVIDRKMKIPALSTLKMRANGALAIEATDLDTFTRAELPYEGEQAEFLLPETSMLLKAMRVAGGERVEFTPGVERRMHGAGDKAPALLVSSGDLTSYFYDKTPADDHPGADRIAEVEFSATLGEDFFRQIARITPAISTEETRYYLNGVYVHRLYDWFYRFVATDGHRLMMVDIPLPDVQGEIRGPGILPRRFVELAIAAFARTGEGVTMEAGPRALPNHEPATTAPASPDAAALVMFRGKVKGVPFSVASKQIHGSYPDYARVVPKNRDFTVRVERKELVRAVLAVATMAREKVRAVRLSLSSRGTLAVEVFSAEVGDSRIEIAAEGKMPADFTIGFNGEYLLDVLRSLQGDFVEIGLSESSAPAVIADPADTSFRAVLMPMRV